MGKRVLLAVTVIAVLVGALGVPQLPAQAADPVAFEHVFSDGDALNKSTYIIPDDFDPCFLNDFVFEQGAYVLVVSASVVLESEEPRVPGISGKGVNWNQNPIHSVAYTVEMNGAQKNAVFAVFEGWADNPETDPTNELTDMQFNFDGQIQDMHTRTFIQTTNPVERANPIRQTMPGAGFGPSAEIGLSPFDDPLSDAAVLAVVKHDNPQFQSWSGVSELGQTTPGSGDCNEGVQQHRVGAGAATGEVLNPSVSWMNPDDWRGVALEINAEGPPTATTTTTTTTTSSTGPSSTTTTVPPTPSTTVVEDSNRFIDDDDSVFEADIEAIAEAGVTQGCNPPTNDRFCPGDTLTRGQMAAFMARALGLGGNPPDRFTDDDASVFENDIELIAEAEITLGCNPPTNDRFCPTNTLSRGQMAAFMARALGLTGDPVDRFVDDDNSIFEAEIELIAEAEITVGCNPPTNDRFCPELTLTRGEMAAFLNRMLEYLG